MRSMGSGTRGSLVRAGCRAAPLAALLLTGCARQATVQTIGSNWAPSLNDDLRLAVEGTEADFSQRGWDIHVKWAGARGSTYRIERGPLGEPMRESVPVLYAFEYPSRSKCYLSVEVHGGQWETRLAREHLGGGQYGPPHFLGISPIKHNGDPAGNEVDCAAIANVNGGVHVGAGGEAPLSSIAPPDAAPTAATAASPQPTSGQSSGDARPYDPEDALSQLAPGLPPSCRSYARAACSGADLPATKDRKRFCEDVVARTNARGKQPSAEKACRTMLAHVARR